jgi:divalent metal cation (Fe/Co/Zn/Cd) transporter
LESVLGLSLYFHVLPVLAFLLQKVVSAPPAIELGSHALVVMLAIGGAVIVSWVIAWYEMGTGKKRRHPSLVADGKETLMDSFVELAILLGLIGSFFGIPYLDLVFGIVVAGAMLHTSKSILSDAMGNLLQKSVEKEYLGRIRKILMQTHGVLGFEEKGTGSLKAFKVGKFIFVSIRVYISPHMTTEGFYYIKKGINERITEVLPGFDVRIYLRGNVIPEEPRRAIIGVKHGKNPLKASIAERLMTAGTYFIVDLKGDRIVTVKAHAQRFKNAGELAAFIKAKHAGVVYAVNAEQEVMGLLPNVRLERTHALIFKDMFH